jgi:hypothetical protein
VAAEGVEDVGGAGEVEHQLVRAAVRHAFDLRARVGQSNQSLLAMSLKWVGVGCVGMAPGGGA